MVAVLGLLSLDSRFPFVNNRSTSLVVMVSGGIRRYMADRTPWYWLLE